MSLLRLSRATLSVPRSVQTSRIRYASTISVTSTRTNASAPLLANIEASWKDLPAEEQYEVYQQLESLQKKDWKELTIDEKKAAYFVAFGPHGPRAPIHHPGNAMRVIGGVAGCVGVAIAIFYAVRSQGQ
ncbi:cytochrome c oxidase subunit 4 [Tremella mesenterica]|uniref:Cytochrome c oxidase subunit 4 n=1 Tax=Tremella mesenterica TaxID=5217 RepID=A0A4Q1BJ06_TREME|nr:cytochrome c oxidase subunit 4 [Tremella mesenterica]